MNYIGIVIHKRYRVAFVQDETGRIIRRERIEGNSVEPLNKDMSDCREAVRPEPILSLLANR